MRSEENFIEIIMNDNILNDNEHRSIVEKSINSLSIALKSYLKYGTIADEVKILAQWKVDIKNTLIDLSDVSVKNMMKIKYPELSKENKFNEDFYSKKFEVEMKSPLKEARVNNGHLFSKKQVFIITEKKICDINNEIKAQMAKTSYLSQMEMLLQLYDSEKIYRNKENKFEQTFIQSKYLKDIIHYVNENRQISISQIFDNVNIKKESLEEILNIYIDYFNIRENKGKTFISLTSEGKSFDRYISTRGTQERSSSEAIIYNVVNNVLDNILKTLDSESEIEFLPVDFLGVSEDKKRTLQRKYAETIFKINKNRENYMTPHSICTFSSKQEEKENYENKQSINNYNLYSMLKGWSDDNN